MIGRAPKEGEGTGFPPEGHDEPSILSRGKGESWFSLRRDHVQNGHIISFVLTVFVFYL